MQEETPTIQERKPTQVRLSFDRFNRRTHLYMALFFLPWFFVYGASSLVFSHPNWFNKGPGTKVMFDRDYRLDPISPQADLRPIADKLQQESGLTGHFAVFRTPDGLIRMYGPTFLKARQITYDPKLHRLRAEQSVFRVSGLLTRLHTRGGFEQPGLLQNAWSVIVDLVQIAIILWIASGLYMWWNLRRHRLWGLAALGGGLALFGLFLLRL